MVATLITHIASVALDRYVASLKVRSGGGCAANRVSTACLEVTEPPTHACRPPCIPGGEVGRWLCSQQGIGRLPGPAGRRVHQSVAAEGIPPARLEAALEQPAYCLHPVVPAVHMQGHAVHSRGGISKGTV